MVTPRKKAHPAPTAVDPLEEVLSKGLTEAPATPAPNLSEEVSVRIRFPADIHRSLSDHLASQPGRVSINTFVLQAVVAKLKADQ